MVMIRVGALNYIPYILLFSLVQSTYLVNAQLCLEKSGNFQNHTYVRAELRSWIDPSLSLQCRLSSKIGIKARYRSWIIALCTSTSHSADNIIHVTIRCFLLGLADGLKLSNRLTVPHHFLLPHANVSTLILVRRLTPCL
jgi:hypothetical protein